MRQQERARGEWPTVINAGGSTSEVGVIGTSKSWREGAQTDKGEKEVFGRGSDRGGSMRRRRKGEAQPWFKVHILFFDLQEAEDLNKQREEVRAQQEQVHRDKEAAEKTR